MSTGWSWKKFGGALLLGAAVLCVESLNPAWAEAAHGQRKPKKPQIPPVASGPTGPVQPIPLDSIPAVSPQVSYQNKQLTIVAPNSTLADILRAVRKQTGAEIEIPPAPERVVTHLGPGPAREVIAELLNGSRFNYVLLGSPADDSSLTRVVLVAKTGPQDVTPNPPASNPVPGQQANEQQQAQEMAQDASEPEAADENNNDDNADQGAAEAEPQPAPAEQPKTPQQLLQEMQQRQLQLQQQQAQPGQPPVPGPGRPPGQPQNDDK